MAVPSLDFFKIHVDPLWYLGISEFNIFYHLSSALKLPLELLKYSGRSWPKQKKEARANPVKHLDVNL